MTTLSISETGELHLTLRGVAEDRILTTVRRWPHWRRVDIERDPMNAKNCLAVTLVTDQTYEFDCSGNPEAELRYDVSANRWQLRFGA